MALYSAGSDALHAGRFREALGKYQAALVAAQKDGNDDNVLNTYVQIIACRDRLDEVSREVWLVVFLEKPLTFLLAAQGGPAPLCGSRATGETIGWLPF